jgi:hypothetical protein
MSKRCAKLVADVAEKLGRQNIRFRQLLPLPRNFSLVGFLFGDIAASAAMNTTLPTSSLTGIREASIMIVSLPPARPKISASQRTNSPAAARAILAFNSALTAGDTCHQNVVQKGLPLDVREFDPDRV